MPGSGSSYKPSNQSTRSRSTEQSTELSTLISSGSLKALQSQKSKARRISEPSTSTAGRSKRQRQDDSPARSHLVRPSAKKSRKQLYDHNNASYTSEETSTSDQDIPVVASRTRLSIGSAEVSRAEIDHDAPAEPAPRLKAIPESLRLRTATTSISTITSAPSTIFSESIFSGPTSTRRHQEQLPPSARRADLSDDGPAIASLSNASRRAQSARSGKSRLVSQPLSRRRSDDGPSRLAEASLPSFKKASKQAALPTDESFHARERRTSAAITEPRQEWALLDHAGKAASPNGADASPLVIQDSAPLDEHTIPLVLSPPKQSNGSNTNRHPVREAWNQNHSPGSRLAYANIEKPRMPVKVPEPSVFRSFLQDTQTTEDIHQFSSQASPPEGSSSEEVLRDLTGQAQPVIERAFPTAGLVLDSQPTQDLPADVPDVERKDPETAPQESSHGVMLVESPPRPPVVETRRDTTVEHVANPDKTSLEAENTLAPTSAGTLQPTTPASQPQTLSSASQQRHSKQVLGPSEIQDVLHDQRTLIAMVRTSILLDSEDTRQDLLAFIEMPGYYCDRKSKSGFLDHVMPIVTLFHWPSGTLTAQASWEFELDETINDEGQTSWHLLLDMEKPDWQLVKRFRPYVTLSEDGVCRTSAFARRGIVSSQVCLQSNEQIMSLYNELLTAHAGLKKENDAAIIRLGQVENDLAFMHQQDRLKGERMEGLAADKRRLEAEVQVLRQQVALGVKQVELIWSAREKKLQQELDTARKQLKFAQVYVQKSEAAELLRKAAERDELVALDERRKAAAESDKKARALRESNALKEYQEFKASLQGSHANYNEASDAAVISQVEAESDDGDYVGGSSSDDGGSSSPSEDDSSEDMPAMEVEALETPLNFSSVQYPELQAAQPVNAALASAEGILPGGLASISPAPMPVESPMGVQHQEGNTSGDTTEITTSVSVERTSVNVERKEESQQSGTSSGGRLIESEEILELDSGILESQLAYACSWGQSSGDECRKLFASQRVGQRSVFHVLASAQWLIRTYRNCMTMWWMSTLLR